MNTIYTFGYQGSTPEQLQAYQQQHNALVVDARYTPWSRDQRWTHDALRALLGQNYQWMQALGNTNYKNGGPIKLAQPKAAANWLRPRLEERPIILLCACWNVETCHRKVAAEYLAEALGAAVEHLLARAEGSPVENMIRCLSLTQPWGTLMAVGAKTIETRSWRTSYRGPVGIHASAGFPKDARSICLKEPFKRTLIAAGIRSLAEDLPRGAVLATSNLVNCVPVEQVRSRLSSEESAFGDYGLGRYAWIFRDTVALAAPVPAKGSLGLWTMDATLLKGDQA